MYNYNAEDNLKKAIEKYPDLKGKIKDKIQETRLQLHKADRVANMFNLEISQSRNVHINPPKFLDSEINEESIVHKRR
tara:strand:+ start:46 stop:279 length:234 start_codon:yes stop_codon:yes gene_type:complete